MGCPLVTLTGETFAHAWPRASCATPDCPSLQGSLDEYESRLVELAADADGLASLRARLTALRATAPLFDTPRFTRHLERAYARMAATSAASEMPTAFDVEREP